MGGQSCVFVQNLTLTKMKLKNCTTMLVYGLILLVFSFGNLRGQSLNVSINQTGFSANSCSRTLTAIVSGGSGNYSYQWSVTAPGVPFPGPSNTRTVTSALNITTDFIVFVRDNSTAATGSSSITVPRVLSGSFDIFIPNAFTPNGDGFNDVWLVVDGDKGFGAINAYRYELNISNAAGVSLFSKNETITAGSIGLRGGDIAWDGRINGTGSIVPNGTYTYSLRLFNCSGNQLLQGFVNVFGVFSVKVSPNPAIDYFSLNLYSYKIKIFNHRHELVKSVVNHDSNPAIVDVRDLQRGLYIVYVITNEGIDIKRLLIE